MSEWMYIVMEGCMLLEWTPNNYLPGNTQKIEEGGKEIKKGGRGEEEQQQQQQEQQKNNSTKGENHADHNTLIKAKRILVRWCLSVCW